MTKVFKMLWPENAGGDEQTVVTGRKVFVPGLNPKTHVQDPRFGEWIFCKIRWFVVLREATNHCVCLYVTTAQIYCSLS